MNNDLENDLRNPEPRGGMTKKTVAEVISKVAAYVGKGGNAALSLFSGLLAAGLILYSGYVLYDTFYTENEAYSAWDVLKQYHPDFTDIEDSEVPTSTWDSMSEITPNYRAWVTIYDTTIDYPIVQGEDDLYYAMHNIYGESSLTGAIYLAAANTPDFSDNYNLLYGHHMDNGAMFGNLDLFMEREYFDAHREGILVTKDKVYDFTIFASIKTDAYAGEAYDLGGNKNLNALKIFIENNALIYDAEASWTPEKVLAFSTCASATTNGRLLVYASLTEREITVPETTPPETEPPETEPGETEPPETTPAGIEPVEPEPGETEPREPEPGETEPTEPEPGETEPREPEPGETEPPIEDIPEEETPLEGLIRRLTPTGSSWYRRGAWALVNLIALIATAYILLPLLRLKGKYGRAKKMKKFNGVKEDLWDAEDMTPDDEETRAMILNFAVEEYEMKPEEIEEKDFDKAVGELYYHVKSFKRRFTVAVILEIIITVVAIIAFIWTENMRLPMRLIDKWTPLMLLFLLVIWLIDFLMTRYRKDLRADEEDDDQTPPEGPAPDMPDIPPVAGTPEEPAEPEEPEEPEQPAEPEKPEEPEQPAEPAEPAEPAAPEQPAAPETPDAPTEPGTPEPPQGETPNAEPTEGTVNAENPQTPEEPKTPDNQ